MISFIFNNIEKIFNIMLRNKEVAIKFSKTFPELNLPERARIFLNLDALLGSKSVFHFHKDAFYIVIKDKVIVHSSVQKQL